MTGGGASFYGGGKTYNNIWFVGSDTVYDSNVFNDFKIDPGLTILFEVGTTQTVSSFTVVGTDGNLITLNSDGEGQFTLSKLSGEVICDYLDLFNSIATGGASWYAGDHSVNEGGNSGWIWGVLFEESVGAGDQGINECSKICNETIFAVPVFASAATLSREFAETLQVASLRLGQTARILAEALVVVDDTIQNVFTGLKLLIERILVVPIITNVATLARTLTETITAISRLTFSASRTFIEAFTATGNIINQTAKTIYETIKATPVFASVGTFAKTLTESVQVVSEKLYQASRTLIEHLNIVPALTRVLTAARTLTETIKMTSQKLFSLSKTLIETVQVIGQKLYQVSRIFIESFNISSAKIIAGAKTLTETIKTAPIFTTAGVFYKTLIEAIQVVSSRIGQTATVLSEALTVTSSTIKATGRILIEAITAGAQNLFATSRTFIETLVVAPIYAKVLTAYKTLTEIIKATGSILKNTGRIFTEALTIGGQISHSIIRIFTETIIVVSGIAQSVSRLFVEALRIGTNLANQTGKIFSEGLIVVSGIVSSISRTFIEIVRATDTITRSIGRTFVNAIGVAGNTIFSTARTLIERITVSPIYNRVMTMFRTFTESVLVKWSKLTWRAFVYTESLAVRGFIAPFRIGKLLIERILGNTWFEFMKTQYVELTDHLQVGMSFVKRTARLFTETVKMAADVIIKYTGRLFTEVVYVAKKNGEYLGLLFGRVLDESVSITGALAEWVIGKLLPETIKVFENIANATARVFVETFMIAGNVVTQTARIFNEVINAVASYARTWTIGRIYTQSVRMTDTKRFRKTQYKVLIDHLTATSALLKRTGRVLLESLSAIGSMGSWAIGKLIIQTVKVSDYLINGGTRVFTETLVVLDNIVLSTGKLLLETVKAISSMGSWVISKLFIQPVKVFASTTNTWTLSRLFTETINAAGNMVSKVAKTFTETVNVIGTFVLNATSKLLKETVNVAATYLKTWTLSRIFIENITAISNMVRRTGRVFTQTINVAGQFVLGTISKLLKETINIFEIVSRALPAKIYTEVIKVSGNAVIVFATTLYENIAVAGQFVLGTISKLLIEIVNIAETFLRTWTLSRVFTETINVIDSIFSSFVKILYETLQVVGSIIFTAGKLLLETLQVGGAIVRAISRPFVEVINVIDQIIGTAFVRIFTEIVNVGHSATKLLGRMFTEILVLKWTRAKFFLNGVMVGLWTKVARVTNGLWHKINRNNN
jgi:hypothetical protein